MCKVLLRNDYWCKGLGQTQPKSEAYGTYIRLRDARRAEAKRLEQQRKAQERAQKRLFDAEAVA
jgi:hypothetical protein